MSTILNWIQNLWGIANSLINFVIHGIESLISLLTNLPEYITTITTAISYLPQIYQGILLATIGVSIIFLITNRGK